MDEHVLLGIFFGILIGFIVAFSIILVDAGESVRVDGQKILTGLNHCDIEEIQEYLIENYPCNVVIYTSCCPPTNCYPEQCKSACEK